MEGIILDFEALVSPWAIVGGVSLLAVGVALMLLGHASDEEKAGRRLYWAEWPVPGTEETSFEEEKLRLAA
ncbi:MAG: hypothetical protein H6Q80_1371 [Deltaproteobacteria bacterium]|jgi:hypothetical protein|nr:hypothetical protein [Deltaproteobacteria bacterium]